MRIRRLQAAAALAVAVSAGALATAAPAVASASTHVSASSHAPASAEGRLAPLPPDWYRQGPYPTKAACDAGLFDAGDDGYTGYSACYYYNGDRSYAPGYYFNVYIP
ncbi:hypothetical protein [Sphaerisporangium album]|uniref:hypothetical protein n=1 Tax=Sphaerisporangium album TaxID=509200 RepID=UPI0011C031DA|nr:hypothetical protein [Sphaerisporangium album]